MVAKPKTDRIRYNQETAGYRAAEPYTVPALNGVIMATD